MRRKYFFSSCHLFDLYQKLVPLGYSDQVLRWPLTSTVSDL